MQVFLIPIGPDRYELYSEMPDEALAPGDPHDPPGLVKRMLTRLRAKVAQYEDERHLADPPRRGLAGRIVARFGRMIAETLAEQRLLWQLRRETAVTAVHPADLDAVAVA